MRLVVWGGFAYGGVWCYISVAGVRCYISVAWVWCCMSVVGLEDVATNGVSIVFGARRGWATNHRFRRLGRPSTQSHSDASPKPLARKPLTPKQQRKRDREDNDQLYPNS